MAPFLLAALALAACGDETPPAASAPESAAVAPAPAGDVPAPAPLALSVETLDHGRFDLASERGRWVVLNYWATWCAPCLKEMPDLDAFASAREDVRVLGLAYEEIAADDMRGFLQEHPVGYPIAIVDVYAPPPPGLEAPRGLPMTHLVGPDGAIVRSFLGPVTGADLEAEIAAAASEAGT
uniref:TlpA family protein disulfide reductase n=1 Tax=Coralloluteibacterium stylophorae TaxID=1776034 RepID=A0A8J7VW93_9GAMM